MSKELKSFNRIKNFQVVVDYEKDEVKTINELLPASCNAVETALNDNHFYFYMVAKICKYLNIDINLHRDLIETENEILNTIVKNEHKLKALEIIKENKVGGLSLIWDIHKEMWFVYMSGFDFPIMYGNEKEEYDLLKEVLL